MPRIIIGKVVGPPGKDGTPIILNGALATEVKIEAELIGGKVVVPKISTRKQSIFDVSEVTPLLRFYTVRDNFHLNRAIKFKTSYGGYMKIRVIGASYNNINHAGITWEFIVGVNIHGLPIVSKSYFSSTELQHSGVYVECMVIDTEWDNSVTWMLKFLRPSTDSYYVLIESILTNPLEIETLVDTVSRTPIYSPIKEVLS